MKDKETLQEARYALTAMMAVLEVSVRESQNIIVQAMRQQSLDSVKQGLTVLRWVLDLPGADTMEAYLTSIRATVTEMGMDLEKVAELCLAQDEEEANRVEPEGVITVENAKTPEEREAILDAIRESPFFRRQ